MKEYYIYLRSKIVCKRECINDKSSNFESNNKIFS